MPHTYRPLSTIARDIRRDWKQVYFGAVPYLQALASLGSIEDRCYEDSGRSVVAYFLGNATTWRGPVAREVKKELNAMLQGKPYQRPLCPLCGEYAHTAGQSC